jgi:hypothetical protein
MVPYSYKEVEKIEVNGKRQKDGIERDKKQIHCVQN